MVNYRRHFVPGGTYFFTVALLDRHSRWLTEYIGLLREAFRDTRAHLAFEIDAIVVLPEHLHTLWTLPPGDDRYPARWQAIKAGFVRGLNKRDLATTRRTDGSALVWQRRYWEHTIRDEADKHRHIDYIHFNPVKHGWVKSVADWPYSSFHRYVREGLLPANWGGTAIMGGPVGEPFED